MAFLRILFLDSPTTVLSWLGRQGTRAVAARFIAAPMITLGFAALAFMVFFAVLCLTALLFMFAGRERALAIGFPLDSIAPRAVHCGYWAATTRQ